MEPTGRTDLAGGLAQIDSSWVREDNGGSIHRGNSSYDGQPTPPGDTGGVGLD